MKINDLLWELMKYYLIQLQLNSSPHSFNQFSKIKSIIKILLSFLIVVTKSFYYKKKVLIIAIKNGHLIKKTNLKNCVFYT